MNFAQKLVMNNVKSQAENLIPKEVKDATKDEKKEEVENEKPSENQNDDNSKANIKSSSSSSKKRKPKLINKTLAIRMFSVLLFHTGVLTIAEYVIHAIQKSKGTVFDEDYMALYWFFTKSCEEFIHTKNRKQ